MKNLRIVVVVLSVLVSALFSSCAISSKARRADAAAAVEREREVARVAVGWEEFAAINKGLATLNVGMELLLSKFPVKAETGSVGRRSLMDLHGELYNSMKSASSDDPSPAQKELLEVMDEVLWAEKKLDSVWLKCRSVLEKFGHPTKQK